MLTLVGGKASSESPSAPLEERTVCAMETVVTMERKRYCDGLKKCLCKIILPCNLTLCSILRNMTGLEHSPLGVSVLSMIFQNNLEIEMINCGAVCTLLKGLTSS